MTQQLIFTLDDFLELFTFNKQISYVDFCKQLSVLDISDKTGNFAVRSDIDTFIDRVAKKDNRKQRLDLYKQKMYRMLVLEPEKALAEWFRRYGSMTNDLKFYFDIPSNNIFNGTTFNGRSNSKYGRVCKNINFETFYNTKKLYNNDSEFCFGLLKIMFEQFKIRNSLAAPAFFDHICKIDDDYGQFCLDFMIGANRASIFNPATFKGIMENVFRGDTIFSPCMGWCAYQLGFYSTNWKNFIATDVIPGVVNNGNLLHTEYNCIRNSSLFELPEKTVDLYLCPSEQLASRHQFDVKYKNQVDAVLFSPPYFDLEIYDSEDQSFASFPNYQDWLTGYWEETVKLCCEVLRPGAKFGFVISNYRNKAKQEVQISQDMRDVVLKHLPLDSQYRVQWSAISGTRQAKKTVFGNFEDLWVFTKS